MSVEFFVSPIGNDRSRGTRGKPFATLAKAQRAVRALVQRGALPPGGVTVWLAAGVYPLADTLAFTGADSGTPTAPITWRALPGDGAARLSGGTRLTDFAPVSDPAVRARLPEAAREHVVVADLRAAGLSDPGALTSRGFGRPTTPAHLELAVNGALLSLTRYPADGFLKISGFPADQRQDDGHGGSIGKVEGGFSFQDPRPAAWAASDDLWVHGYWAWDWADSYERVARLDAATGFVQTAPPHGLYGIRTGNRFYFLNILEELARPGDYYVDRAAGRLYFWPPAPLAGAEVIASRLATPLLTVSDATHLHFADLVFEDGRGTGATVRGGEDVTFTGCLVRRLGNHGIVVTGGRAHRVAHCEVTGTGDGCVLVSGGDRQTLTPAGHEVTDCHLHHYSRWTRCYRPAIGLHGVGLRAAHNHIHDAPHIGIIISGNDHLIEFNDLHHICLETGDVGAFYLGRDYTERGHVVRHNYFHELGGYGFGSMAVYLDDCASGVSVYGNVFYRASRAVLLGGGRDHVIENNLFIECAPAVWVDGRGLSPAKVWHDMVYETMRERLAAVPAALYRARYPALAELDAWYARPDGVPPGGIRIVRNIAWKCALTQIHWGATPAMVGIEYNLVDRDPRFVAPARQDWRLRPDSPAWPLGFRPIPLSRIGPRARGDGGAQG